MHTRTGDSLRTALGAIWNVLDLARELSCDRVVHLALLLALFEVAQVNGGKHGASIAELADRTGTTLEVARHGVRSLRMHGLVTITERAARTEFFALEPTTMTQLLKCVEGCGRVRLELEKAPPSA